jgi:hypothetical protein
MEWWGGIGSPMMAGQLSETSPGYTSTPAAFVMRTDTGEHGPITKGSGPCTSPAWGAEQAWAESFLRAIA